MTRKVTISLPDDLAAAADRAVATGDARSMSAYVAGALAAQEQRRTAFAALESLYGGRPSEQALAEARHSLGLAPLPAAPGSATR